jgi:hypothetical protein
MTRETFLFGSATLAALNLTSGIQWGQTLEKAITIVT